jgi:hypothetical protein
MTTGATNYERVGVRLTITTERDVVGQREMWPVLLLLMLVELGCVGLWAATGSGMPLVPALATGLAIVYLVLFSGR